jgi:hypothetical protein
MDRALTLIGCMTAGAFLAASDVAIHAQLIVSAVVDGALAGGGIALVMIARR